MQLLRVPLWLLLMIFNINALISRALAAATIFGAVSTSIMNAISFSLCATVVGEYEQHSSLQFELCVFFKVYSLALVTQYKCDCHRSAMRQNTDLSQ